MCVCVCIFKLSTIKQQKKESRARAVTHARTHTHAQSIRNPIKILHYREKHIVPLKKRKKIIKKTNECSADFPKKKIHETRNKTTRKENKRRKRERENGERIVGHHHHRKMNENVLSWRTEKKRDPSAVVCFCSSLLANISIQVRQLLGRTRRGSMAVAQNKMRQTK